MKSEYQKMITKQFSKECKAIMRAGLNRLYNEELDETHTISSTWVVDGEIPQGVIDEAVTELLYECVTKNIPFGNYRLEVREANDGSQNPLRTYKVAEVILPTGC